jgi:hypothetical protein
MTGAALGAAWTGLACSVPGGEDASLDLARVPHVVQNVPLISAPQFWQKGILPPSQFTLAWGGWLWTSLSVWTYNDIMSVKFQITLPDDLALELKQAASREKLPLAQLIRETMVVRLRQTRSPSGGDPFDSITNLVDAPDTDLSESVDEILYK